MKKEQNNYNTKGNSNKVFRRKIINVAEVDQLRWLEESGQCFENVDRTHLILASGKPVLQQKNFVSVP